MIKGKWGTRECKSVIPDVWGDMLPKHCLEEPSSNKVARKFSRWRVSVRSFLSYRAHQLRRYWHWSDNNLNKKGFNFKLSYTKKGKEAWNWRLRNSYFLRGKWIVKSITDNKKGSVEYYQWSDKNIILRTPSYPPSRQQMMTGPPWLILFSMQYFLIWREKTQVIQNISFVTEFIYFKLKKGTRYFYFKLSH